MNYNWRRIFSIGLVFVTVFALLSVSLAGTLVPAKPGGGGGKPPGEEPPADPVIAFTFGENLERLLVMNADGSHSTLVYRSHNRMRVFSPTWSPDGTSIAFARLPRPGGGYSGEIWAIDVEVVDGKPKGSNARMLLNDCYPGTPAWSPAGDKIAIAGNPVPGGMASAIQVIPATGGAPHTLYSGHYVRTPTWSPDALKIAFSETDENDVASIKILDVNTETVIATLIEGQFSYPSHLDWARTQDVIAFNAYPSGGGWQVIYTLNIDTGIATEVVVTDGGATSPTWSPDDSHMAFQGSGYVPVIMSIDLGTGEVTPLQGGLFPDWSRVPSV